jgi:glycerol-3-phosphate dehydrogenase
VNPFVRQEQLIRATDAAHTIWDMIVIGGGATGVGIAVDAASRGYSVLLLEQHDFGKGTSSRSTKLVHGGVRYQQGNISLVREALEERAILLSNAPHVVHDLAFIIPCPNWWQAFFYGTGLKLYDLLAGKHNLAKSKRLKRSAVLAHIPTLDSDQCAAGILYHDGQFDDARLLINLAQTAVRHGACLLNYAPVVGLVKDASGRISGVRWRDAESDSEHTSQARVVINATGPFCDAVRRMSHPQVRPIVAASQGVHIVLPRHFLPGSTAMMVPKTSDGRVVFLIPWHDAVVLGTTDTAIPSVTTEPRPQTQEIDFLLETVAAYLPKSPTRNDIQSVFTGIRPLVLKQAGKRTSQLSRDHTIEVSDEGLLTITGGKWTTYRRMAEDCVNRAVAVGSLSQQPCVTRSVAISGSPNADQAGVNLPTVSKDLSVYGSEAASVQLLGQTLPAGNQRLDARVAVSTAQVLWAVRHEMARSVEDVLARRTRALFINVAAAVAIAPRVAELMAEELGKDLRWQAEQISQFHETAAKFRI